MYACRQTVLEPISRFCNYFPDINECNPPDAAPFPPFSFPNLHAILQHLPEAVNPPH